MLEMAVKTRFEPPAPAIRSLGYLTSHETRITDFDRSKRLNRSIFYECRYYRSSD